MTTPVNGLTDAELGDEVARTVFGWTILSPGAAYRYSEEWDEYFEDTDWEDGPPMGQEIVTWRGAGLAIDVLRARGFRILLNDFGDEFRARFWGLDASDPLKGAVDADSPSPVRAILMAAIKAAQTLDPEGDK